MVKWSPPFLWPGQHIDHFQVRVRNLTDGSAMLDRVNATYKDNLVSYIKHITRQQVQMCTELLFLITAIDTNDRPLSFKTIKITGKSISS